MSVLISIQGCEQYEPNAPEIEYDEVTINEPTNDYIVFAEIRRSGSSGHTSVVVENNGPVTNAEVKINGLLHPGQNSNSYFDNIGVIGYGLTNTYELTVEVEGIEIARGTAVMPSQAPITNIAEFDRHETNQPLQVDWRKASNSTSIRIFIKRPDNSEEFVTEYLGIEPTTSTLDGSIFNLAGNYKFRTWTYHGYIPGLNEDPAKGYNIEGAAGSFIVINSTPEVLMQVSSNGATLAQESASEGN